MLSNILRPVTIIALCAAYSMPNLASLRADELNIDATTSETAPDHQPSRVSRLSQCAHWASVGLAAFTGLGSFAQMWQGPSISYAINNGSGYPSDIPQFTEPDLVDSITFGSHTELAALQITLDNLQTVKNDPALKSLLTQLQSHNILQKSVINCVAPLQWIYIYKTPTNAIVEFTHTHKTTAATKLPDYHRLFWASLSSLTSPYSSQFMRAWRGASALVAAGLTYWLYRHPPQAPAKTASLSQSQKITKALSGEYVDQQTQTRTGLGLMLTGAMIAVGSYFILPKCSNLLLTPLPQTMSLGAILSLRGIAIASNRS
jgi:hypothetical protein